MKTKEVEKSGLCKVECASYLLSLGASSLNKLLLLAVRLLYELQLFLKPLQLRLSKAGAARSSLHVFLLARDSIRPSYVKLPTLQNLIMEFLADAVAAGCWLRAQATKTAPHAPLDSFRG